MAIVWGNEDIAQAQDVVHEKVAREAVVYSARSVAPGVVVVTGSTRGSFRSWLVGVDDHTILGSYDDSEEAVRAARRSWNANRGTFRTFN